jgi:class 3 adenylate cyclase/predicted ATPase
LNCSTCGTPGQLGQKFCSNCGSRLGAACPNCGAPVAADARFCGECGTRLQASETTATQDVAAQPPAPSADLAASAERRLVSVLFADLVGFTTIAEKRDAEEVRELLTPYFETAREIVGRYGGTIEKFIGDAVMAVWGAPTAHEDDAERAVRAALDLVEAAGSIGEQVGVPELGLRAGVLTGEAAVTVGAEGQGMVAGDLVNTASRLQSVAEPGTVLVGQATRDAASEAITFEEVGAKSLKGKALPVQAWRAVRVVAGVGGAGRYTGLEPPFEGREEQLRLLKDLFHATAREKRARLVSILGQAGTGKSRLLREFEKYTDGLAEIVHWHIGRSPSYGEGISYWALGEMVRKRAGLAERDDDATTRQRIAATLEEFVPDEADRRWIEPRLLQLLGVGEAPAGEREEVFAAWRTFFERVAEKGPVVMAFEDLENADAGLLDFIDHLVEWSRNQPIFVIGLTRPELLDRRPSWGAGQRNYAAIGLEPLSDDAMRQALTGLVPGLPEPAVKAILTRAEGVPLYAVETVRMLLNDGRLTEQDGVYQPVGDLADLQIPNTLQALIAARMDALDKGDRAVVLDASVLGHSFTLAALVGVSGGAETELETRLRSLVRREMLEIDVDPRSPERGQYAFVQGLLREVAYSTLSKKDRRTRHLAAARYFESLGDEELAGVLARHYLDAWKAAPEGPEADAIAAQARVALRAAAERATALHSHAQALTYLEHLLAVTADQQERVLILERAAYSAEAAGRYDDIERYAFEAVDLSRAMGDPGGMARAFASLGRKMIMSTELERGIEVIEAALAELGDRDDDPAFVELLAVLSRLRSLHNEDELAIALAERAAVAAEKLDLIEVIAGVVLTKAVSLSYLRRTREAMILLPGVLQMAESHGLVLLEMRARLNLSQFGIVDDPRAAFDVARIGLEHAQKLGLRHWEELLSGNATMAATRIGEWDWALANEREVVSEAGTTDTVDETLGYAAAIDALRGDGGARLTGVIEVALPAARVAQDPQFADGLQALSCLNAFAGGNFDQTIALAIDHVFADPTYATLSTVMATHAALWSRDVDRAREVARVADAMFARGRWSDACRAAREAGLLGLDGRVGEAVAAFEEALRPLRESRVRFDLALCLVDVVATLGVEVAAGRAAANEAREILDRLGAVAVLRMLDALESDAVGAATGAASPASAAANR